MSRVTGWLAALARLMVPDPQGRGFCVRCGFPYAIRREHFVVFDGDGASIAFTCRGCWAALDVEGRLAYAYLAMHGTGEGFRSGELWPWAEQDWPRLQAAVRRAA